MTNLNLEYQVRVEQYRDLYREAQQEQLWVSSGLAASRAQSIGRITRSIRQAAESIACRLPLVQTASYCRAPTGV
jgi:hypothetical protein